MRCRRACQHFEQTSSKPKVLLKSSDQRMYLDVFLGLSCSTGVAGVGSAGEGTTSLREAAWDERTPKYLTRCRFGGGTSATSRAMKGGPLPRRQRLTPIRLVRLSPHPSRASRFGDLQIVNRLAHFEPSRELTARTGGLPWLDNKSDGSGHTLVDVYGDLIGPRRAEGLL